MPQAAFKVCRRAGCPNLTTDKGGFCEEHANHYRKAHDAERGTASERGYGATWRKVRAAQLRRRPLCERCDSRGHVTAASLVHHIDHNQRNNMAENLMSLCGECHEIVHGRKRGEDEQANDRL